MSSRAGFLRFGQAGNRAFQCNSIVPKVRRELR